jgi:hypothetical protein
MLKPEKVWKVGDRTFVDYAEAQKYLSTHKAEHERAALATFFAAVISKCPYGQAEVNCADDFADALLARYVVKLRK